MLRALLMPRAITEGLADAVGHAAENPKRRGRRFGIEEVERPPSQLAVRIRILRRAEWKEGGKLLVVVTEMIGIRPVIRREREALGGILLVGHGRDAAG